MDCRTQEILSNLAQGRLPAVIPTDCEYRDEIHDLVSAFSELQRFALSLSRGDLGAVPTASKGPAIGSLKSLQSSLKHLTWQAQQVALGDFSQRVDFLGEFSEAFNTMVEKLSSAREELTHASTHDALTGLYNRAFFETELERLARGRVFPIAVMMIDLDGLKKVNDVFGHAEGDTLLARAADVLRGALRGEDVIARLGGDEFAVILPEVGEAAAERVLLRLASACARVNEGALHPVRMSAGLAVATTGLEVGTALRIADQRMYQNKALRKAGCGADDAPRLQAL